MTLLEGAVAVVTGGGSGIGLGIAEALHEAGARVVIADVSYAAAREAAEKVGGFAVRTDVTDEDSVKELAKATLSHFGHADILVNNAGIGPEAPISTMTTDDWRWLLDVNLWGVIYGVQAFLPILEQRPSAHIVNVASMSALAPMPPLGGYAVSKAGVTVLTEVLARELDESDSSVHATLVMPGPVRTNIGSSLRNRPSTSHGALQEFRNSPPEGLWLTPMDVGHLVVEGIRDNRPYVITHPGLWPRVEERHRRLAAAFGQPVNITAAKTS